MDDVRLTAEQIEALKISGEGLMIGARPGSSLYKIGAAITVLLADLLSTRTRLEEALLFKAEMVANVPALRERADTLAAENARLRDLVTCLLDNDPDDLAADGGVTVLDIWRKDASKVMGR